ncbi:MAG: hypothetical protein ICV60_00220 [Pyrinomonadaceae bacterium]|nr:hypothetical protein [Pyrinomonadaceae bacterium]
MRRKQARLKERKCDACAAVGQRSARTPGVTVNVNLPSAQESKPGKHRLPWQILGWLIPVNLGFWLLISSSYVQEDNALVKTFLEIILKVLAGYVVGKESIFAALLN